MGNTSSIPAFSILSLGSISSAESPCPIMRCCPNNHWNWISGAAARRGSPAKVFLTEDLWQAWLRFVSASGKQYRANISINRFGHLPVWLDALLFVQNNKPLLKRIFHKEQYTRRRGAHWAPEGYDILTASFIRNTFRVLSLRAVNGRPYVNQVKNNHAEQSDKLGFRINGISG